MRHTPLFLTRKEQTSYFTWVRRPPHPDVALIHECPERTVGGLDVFLPYIRDYVETFSGKSITTQQWKEHLYAYFQKHNEEKISALDSVNWDVGISKRSVDPSADASS